MKVFVAGGSGAMGMRLVPQLVNGGYDVVAMTRSRGKVARLQELGAEAVIADALDRAAVVSTYLRGIDNTEIIHAVYERSIPMIPASPRLALGR